MYSVSIFVLIILICVSIKRKMLIVRNFDIE